MIERFADDDNGGFFETSSDHEQLVARRKDLEDHPIPSGNSSAAYGLLRLAALTGEHEYAERAESRAAPAPRARAEAPAGVRPPAPGARLPARAGEGGRARGRRAAARSSAWCATRSARTWCSPAARPAACRCWRAATPSTGAPPPTSASSSPAGRPSPSRRARGAAGLIATSAGGRGGRRSGARGRLRHRQADLEWGPRRPRARARRGRSG